ATVSVAIDAVSRSGDPAARVMDGGRLVGVVDHACLLDVVAGTTGPGHATGAQDAPAAPDAPDGSREVTL
ncbi:glycine/betaine ABC transporter ATP-binding protein, partial [Streptomyces anulatus]